MKVFVSCLVVMVAVVVSKARLVSFNVRAAFKQSNLNPDVVDKSPYEILKVRFPSGVVANLGNELTPTQVKDQPWVSYVADKRSYYTLIFIDPDNYDGPDSEYREFQHWLVGNIPGDQVSQGEVLTQYISSGPLEGSGKHRYTFIVFKQPEKIHFREERLYNTSIEGRDLFSTRKFAENYCLGNPVAGNFYRAQYDEYVNYLYKSLGAEDLLKSS